ncbi:hypothetical protein K466DRAFT_604566 [Polyporus arcularius HHB13444]|uniref:Uncharacterized protein n=1 Tax=Polyporus arcularius HHB13444 TaxID=1314778 RepID=A0A5C3NXU4_9APHY|nr:hypothetical protein K466DRAFT_604566 [Polyporus arcularius HHB13444]
MADQQKLLDVWSCPPAAGNTRASALNGDVLLASIQEDMHAPEEKWLEAGNEAPRSATSTLPLVTADALMEELDPHCTPLSSPAPPSPAPYTPLLEPASSVRDEDIEDFHLPPPALPLNVAFPMSSYPGIVERVESAIALYMPQALTAVDPLPEKAPGDESSSLLDVVQPQEEGEGGAQGAPGAIWGLLMAPTCADARANDAFAKRTR